MMNRPKLILASASADRAESFQRAKIEFEVIESNIDEEELKSKGFSPVELAQELANLKALKVKKKVEFKGVNAIIIAGDTIVELNGELIGKSPDEEHAFQTLKMLSGKTHKLISAIAITQTFNHKIISDCDVTSVSFIDLSDNEIQNYIKTEEWKGRAGAYSINDKSSLFIDKIEGSPSTVVGLPMHKLFQILKKEFNYNLLTLSI